MTLKKLINVALSSDDLQALDDWRFANRSPSRSEALRSLMRLGLGVGAAPAQAQKAAPSEPEAAFPPELEGVRSPKPKWTPPKSIPPYEFVRRWEDVRHYLDVVYTLAETRLGVLDAEDPSDPYGIQKRANYYFQMRVDPGYLVRECFKKQIAERNVVIEDIYQETDATARH